MQQDQRIGLAFGVLLIGACAAFFFRNETRERSQTPQLQNAQQLDDRIAQKANRPYLTGIKTVEAGGRSRVRIVADRAHDTDEEHSDLSWSPPGPFGSRNGGASRADMESDVLELDPIPVPGELRSTNATTQENTPAEGAERCRSLGTESRRDCVRNPHRSKGRNAFFDCNEAAGKRKPVPRNFRSQSIANERRQRAESRDDSPNSGQGSTVARIDGVNR